MKLYLIVTGIVFALLFLAHVARLASEGWHLATGAVFAVTTLGSLLICVWAFRLYKNIVRNPPPRRIEAMAGWRGWRSNLLCILTRAIRQHGRRQIAGRGVRWNSCRRQLVWGTKLLKPSEPPSRPA